MNGHLQGLLPPGWILTTVGSLCNVVRGASPRPKGDPRFFGGAVPWITIGDVTATPGKYLSTTRECVTLEGAAHSRLVDGGTLIVSNSGSICIPVILTTQGCIHDGWIALNDLSPAASVDYLYYFFEHIRPAMRRKHRQGMTQVNLNTTIFKQLEVPVPPVPEQHRIVPEIEKHFTRLDQVIATLEGVRAKLKQARASVLKAAVEGRLVRTEADLARAERREYEPASDLLRRILDERRRSWPIGKKYEPPVEPVAEASAWLPEGWCWATVDQVSKSLRYGTSAKCSSEDLGVPVLRMGNLVDGRLSFADLKYLPPDHEEFPDELLQPGELLFNRTNSAELVGKTAIFEGFTRPCACASYLIRVTLLKHVLPQYLGHCINSARGRAWVRSVVNQQVGQANVNGTKLAAHVFPLPPTAEQTRIVSEVARQVSVLDAIDTAAQDGLARCGRLRQSMLKQAFEGKLVPQNPSDEPAAVLLGRIGASGVTAAQPTTRKMRKGRRAS